MTVEKTQPGLGMELPHEALLSAQSRKHVLVTQCTRGSASLVLQRSPTLRDFRARGPEVPGRRPAQPAPDRISSLRQPAVRPQGGAVEPLVPADTPRWASPAQTSKGREARWHTGNNDQVIHLRPEDCGLCDNSRGGGRGWE